MKEQLQRLKDQGAKSFALDMRGNPGGLLTGGTETASPFLDSDKPLVFALRGRSRYLQAPASAAEVMTATLKENGRAIVVGRKTFGKGIIQMIRQLSNDNGGVVGESFSCV